MGRGAGGSRWTARLGAQRTPDGVEGIAEAVPSAGFVAFRPEQGEESLPGTAEISANGEHGEGRLGPAFGQRGAGAPERPSRAKPPSTRSRNMPILVLRRGIGPILRP